MTRDTLHGRTRAEERMAEIDISPKKLLADIEGLTAERDAARQEIERAQKERDDYLAALQRERAEFVNFRRRTAEERQAMLGLASESLILKVLALADDFDRAIETRPASIAEDAWVEGIAAIDRKLRQLLESEGVSQIKAARGAPFDPRQHEAIASVPGTGVHAGHVIDELRRGYRLRDRVIRPAMVTVADGDGLERAADRATDLESESRADEQPAGPPPTDHDHPIH